MAAVAAVDAGGQLARHGHQDRADGLQGAGLRPDAPARPGGRVGGVLEPVQRVRHATGVRAAQVGAQGAQQAGRLGAADQADQRDAPVAARPRAGPAARQLAEPRALGEVLQQLDQFVDDLDGR
ncbi:hypothetical protein K7G98_03965 [Saccharothrix sp. MB29]|nr:hypothetical protein [Saccharothrix sp. MB29]